MSWPPQTFTWDGILTKNFRTPTEAELAGPIKPLTDDAEEVTRLLREVARARAYLRKIEWSDRETGEDRCPECGAGRDSDGKHEIGCELAALIAKV